MASWLEGKVAVITGGGNGIGRAMAHLFAQEGAKVVVNDYGVNPDGTEPRPEVAEQVVEEIKAAGGTAVPSPYDVASWEGARQIIETALRHFGRIDILCNVAGILRDRMVFNMTEEEWDAVIAVHLKGNIFCSRHAAPYMVRQRWGRIINFSSSSGFGNSGQANYSAAKEGIAGFTYALARELGPYGVTCNIINPSASTRLTATVPAQAREIRAARGIAGAGGVAQRPTAGGPAAQAPQRVGPESAAGTPQDPMNNVPILLWLCTDAGGAVNGQRISSGGWQVNFVDNRRVIRSISKFGQWSVEELERLVPSALMQGIPNPAPAAPPEQQPQQQASSR